MLNTAYALPYALAQPFLGPLGDRFGKQRCVQFCIAGLALMLAAGAFANSFALLLATRVLAGIFAGGLIPLVLAGPVGPHHDADSLNTGAADEDNPDVRYWREEVEPLVDGRLVRWVGTVQGVERDDLVAAIGRLRQGIQSLNREGRERFLVAFEHVSGHFQQLFTKLFGGGKAELRLTESEDPLEAGLEIHASPPGKKLQVMSLLSGGEQALTAISLLFAVFMTNPAPICVLDEVDAPLDDANIERFCDLLDRMTEETDTRYLIVTHNAVTMARMHRLFGVTMMERGVSRLVSVDLGGAETLLAAE